LIKERVKYYPSNDFLYGHNLTKIEVIQVPKYESINVNDAIEFFQITQYFDEGVRCKTWSDSEYDLYKEKSEKLTGLTKRFFNSINDENVICICNAVEIEYRVDFWVLFDNCKLYDRISSNTFSSLIEGENISPNILFRHKNLVKKYGEVFRKYILSHDFCVAILLHVYEQDYTEGEKYWLPDELTGEEICSYLEAYVDGSVTDINHLSAIVNMHTTKDFPITDEIRLKAKRKYDLEAKKISETGVRIEYGIQVAFDPNQNEEKSGKNIGNDYVFSYSTQYLKDTLDFPSILNNFVYLFEFVDLPQMRSLHVSKKSQESVFERLFSSKSARKYSCGSTFRFMQALSLMQIAAYYDFLQHNKVFLEDVLHWFFTEYLQEEYACATMRFSMPSSACTYSEKCYSIITAFESVIKQYCLFVKNGDVDFDLVAMSTTPILFQNIKSQINGKYIYGAGEEYNRIVFMMFSDQCMFSYVKRISSEGRSYNCFLDLLLNENVYLSDYREEEKSAFDYLSSFDLITINEDGKLELKDRVKLAILRELYKNEVVSPKHYPESAKYAFSDFLEKGLVIEKSTLLTQPEIDYLNYLLNRSEYTNGLEIRNKYIHGIQQVVTNEEEHKQNYFVLLKLFVLLAIKINDDFELKKREENAQAEG